MASSDLAPSAASKNKQTQERSEFDALQKQIATLESENRKLRNLAEHRSASLSHLAHELRTPLTSILGFAEILLTQEKLTDAQRNFCERIQNSAQQLQRTLNQVAELSRVTVAPDDDLQSS